MLGVFTALTFNSCKKDKYQPIGDYGDTNITTTNTVTPTNWTTTYDDGTNFALESTLSVPGITQDVFDKGAVLVYILSSGRYYALSYSDAGNTYSATFNYSFAVGSIIIECTGYDNTGSYKPADLNGQYTFKTVILSSAAKKMHPNVDLTNFDEVKKEFNLQ